MKKWILPLFVFFCANAFSQEVTKLTAGNHNGFGLAYSLPKTIVNIEITATKYSVKAGPYYRYAEIYLGAQNVFTQDTEYWELNGINYAVTAVADKENSYVVNFKEGSAVSFYVNGEGLLCSINMSPKLDRIPLASTIQPVTLSPNDEAPSTFSVMTQEQLNAGSTAKQAEIAARQIYKIRESRINYATGDVDQRPDAESYKLIMAQLDAQESALTQMFLGTNKKETVKRVFSFSPSEDINNEILFRFSKYLGIVEKDNLSGEPVFVNFKITEDRRIADADDTDAKKAVKKDNDKKQGIAYIFPGKGVISINNDKHVLAEEEFSFAQLGCIMRFPSNMFDDKKAPAKAEFYPLTGGVKEIVQ